MKIGDARRGDEQVEKCEAEARGAAGFVRFCNGCEEALLRTVESELTHAY